MCVCVYIHVFMDGIYRYIRKVQMFNILFYFLDFISSFLLEKEIDILGTMTKYRTSMEVFGMLVFSVTPNKARRVATITPKSPGLHIIVPQDIFFTLFF